LTGMGMYDILPLTHDICRLFHCQEEFFMALKNERTPAPAKGSREAYEFSYAKARSNLLLAAIFTLVNVFWC
jgi:hypothetical protein